MALGQGNTITNQNRHAPPHAGVAEMIPSATAAGPSSPGGSAAPYSGMRVDWGTGESLDSIIRRRDLPIGVRIDRWGVVTAKYRRRLPPDFVYPRFGALTGFQSGAKHAPKNYRELVAAVIRYESLQPASLVAATAAGAS